MPVKTPLDFYECRHGMGYTVITGKKNGLCARQTSLVPQGATALVTRLELANESDQDKSVDLYSFIEFCLWNAMDDSTNFQRNFSTGEVEVVGSAIYHKTEYRERRNHYAVYFVNAPVAGFETDRDTFLGAYNSLSEPQVVTQNASRNSMASGWAPVGSHHVHVELKPGEKKSLIFVLGYCENPVEEKFVAPGVINKAPAEKLMAAFSTDRQFEDAMARQRAYWDDLLGKFRLSSADERLDRTVNIWNQYQCMVTFNMSRSALFFETGIGRGT